MASTWSPRLRGPGVPLSGGGTAVLLVAVSWVIKPRSPGSCGPTPIGPELGAPATERLGAEAEPTSVGTNRGDMLASER
eukprot:2137354-Heterocapsa_arctica.AAC.1